jgi:hypothetical protein
MRHHSARAAAQLERVSGWVFDRGTGHAALHRGPVLYETYCGRSVPGPLVAETPTRVCASCRRHIEQGSYERTRREEIETTEVQGRLW